MNCFAGPFTRSVRANFPGFPPMKFSYALIAGGLLAAVPVRAVYAPIPEPEQGKDLTVAVTAGAQYDSNIFGGATDAINSMVWRLAPKITYNASLSDQTFFSAHYALTLDEIERRPGDKLLDSHEFSARLAHAFSSSTNVDVVDTLMIARNPESLLNGVPRNTDQSFTRNQVDGRFVTPLGPKMGVTAKVRSAMTSYRNAVLGRSLDRTDNLYGVATDYAVLPEMKAVAEYRHQDIYYRKEGVEKKNKRSDYLMGGFDYEAAKKLTLSGRFGGEWRSRVGAPDTTAPFLEFSGRYAYAERSFLTGGVGYTIDESSDPDRFTDQKVTRYFVNVQHALTALIVASLSADYEPAELQARPPITTQDLSETVTRVGAALSYLPGKNWTISASYDLDHVESDDPSRTVVRHRAGMSVTYSF